MSIFVNRITKITQQLPKIPSTRLPYAVNLNCLNFFPNNIEYNIPLYQLTPYYLRDEEGHIFENIWQGSKIYHFVSAQTEIKANKVIWQHPTETHVINGLIQPAYWAWRSKVYNNQYAVRFPNGYEGRHKCLGALWKTRDRWELLPYIVARKKIYCKVYAELVQKTEAYTMIKKLYDQGFDLQICEMDVRPSLITRELLKTELHNTKESFGHGYVLASCLLGATDLFDDN